MLALVANKAFDNPYACWNFASDFNADPAFMGYYAVGMSLIGISKWLAEIVKRRGIENICFLARDGYLPMKAFVRMREYFDTKNVQCMYVPCSRKAVFPWMVENEEGLYALPIEYKNHTALSLSQMLSCCIKESVISLSEEIEAGGFLPDKCFSTEREFLSFIDWFRKNLFDSRALNASKEITTEYYRSQIPQNSLVFDLGYSGNIPAALQKALGYPVVFAYQHHDNNKFYENVRRGDLDVECMYNLIPAFSDLIRELFFSEYSNSCEGLRREGVTVVPVLNSEDLPYAETFAVSKIEDGAMQFIDDFSKTFSGLQVAVVFEPTQVCLPLEGLIHECSSEDQKVFAATFSDDAVYGGATRISITEFWRSQTRGISVVDNQCEYGNLVQAICYGRGRVEKFLIYAICDRKTLKDKVKSKLQRQPVIMFIAKKLYSMLRSIHRLFRRR